MEQNGANFNGTSFRDSASRLNKAERTALLEAFRKYDKDDSGFITRSELFTVIRDMNVYDTPEAEAAGVTQMLEKYDKSNDEKIDQEEFLGMMAESRELPMTERELRSAFAVFDLDDSGTVNGLELKKCLGNLGPAFLSEEECEDLMRLVDTDNSGSLNTEEFVKFFLAGAESPPPSKDRKTPREKAQKVNSTGLKVEDIQ